MYGGDPARVLTTQSWRRDNGGGRCSAIGRTTDSGTALHWDDSERKLLLGVRTGNHLESTSTTFKIKAGAVEKISLDSGGNASITGVLAMGGRTEYYGWKCHAEQQWNQPLLNIIVVGQYDRLQIQQWSDTSFRSLDTIQHRYSRAVIRQRSK